MGVIVLTSCVCVSVCVCVCLLPLSCLNRQTYRPEFWYVGQVEGYLGQVHRSRSKVKGQGHQVKKRFNVFSSEVKRLELQWGRNKPDEAVQRGRWKTSITFYSIRVLGLQRGVFSKRMRFFVSIISIAKQCWGKSGRCSDMNNFHHLEAWRKSWPWSG